jgi:hypothetical protein
MTGMVTFQRAGAVGTSTTFLAGQLGHPQLSWGRKLGHPQLSWKRLRLKKVVDVPKKDRGTRPRQSRGAVGTSTTFLVRVKIAENWDIHNFPGNVCVLKKLWMSQKKTGAQGPGSLVGFTG